jgi:pimeloyl-ACP methyl ester carboxylesterase
MPLRAALADHGFHFTGGHRMTQAIPSQNGQYIKANGLNIYYEEYGTGEPLVLLHGGMAIGNVFEPQIAVFSKQFRVIAPDSRGHGKTDNPSGEFSYRLMADDMAAFIDALGLGQPSVCGWSDGGQTALELGMHYPDLIQCVVVGAAWYRFSRTYQDLLGAMGFESPGSVNIERIKQSMPRFVGLWQLWHSSMHGPDHWETLATQISTMWWTPLNYTADDFQKIKSPTLILVGDRDQMVPLEEAVEMYRLIPGAELTVAPHSDHSLPRTRAELFSTIVFDFLLRHRAQVTAK